MNIETDPKNGRQTAIVDSDGFYVERTRRAGRQADPSKGKARWAGGMSPVNEHRKRGAGNEN